MPSKVFFLQAGIQGLCLCAPLPLSCGLGFLCLFSVWAVVFTTVYKNKEMKRSNQSPAAIEAEKETQGSYGLIVEPCQLYVCFYNTG